VDGDSPISKNNQKMKSCLTILFVLVGLVLKAQVVDRELTAVRGSLKIPQIIRDTSLHYGCITSNYYREPIYILNGKEISRSDFARLDVKLILSIVVIKGTDAEKEYGSKAKDGVLIITTKSS